ncbi:ead/Ea22-like family protein [Kluyvera ascorbata]|uniref:ead/Ea22-like family protein n=1 Tax=Kluyvera ascorbata TaxID=51288 RepID=UPI002055014E|nr:ead/Ea22-like family protein [Kluyvera ascorbata]UPQ70556.1 ead/Ea22-like family protein [Kluyvera ascorbata]
MNDITALMATMKAAAENLDGDTWHDEGASVYGGAYDVGDTVCYDHIVDCENVNGESLVAEFIAVANPANVLALVEALEARDKQIARLEKKLSDRKRMNQEMATAMLKPVADESRTVTVKLRDDFQLCHYGTTEDYAKGYIDCQNNFTKWLAAAGIQVIEGEGQ